MDPQTTPKREYSTAELAMMDDIGSARLDKLPLQDRGMVPRDDAAAIESLQSGRTGTNNKWNQAIASGLFDDEDAAVVAGQETIANGQLARLRRAANLSYMTFDRSIDYDEGRLRRDHNGQVVPRMQYRHGYRGLSLADRAHKGNVPVDMCGKMPSMPHAPGSAQAPASASGSSRLRSSSFSSRNSTLPPNAPHAPVPIRPQSSHTMPLSQAVAETSSSQPLAQSAAVWTSSSSAPGGHHELSKGIQTELPDGYSVVFQAPAIFASPTFLDRNAGYPGTMYLVAGRDKADDQIILNVDEQRMDDVKRSAKEYVDFLSDSDKIILQFRNGSGHITWFVVIFHHRDVMVSFAKALREFVKRPDTALPDSSTSVNGSEQAVIGAKGLPSTDDSSGNAVVLGPEILVASSMSTETPQNNAHSTLTHQRRDEAPVSPPAKQAIQSISSEPQATRSTVQVSQQKDATNTLSVVIIDDIVSWAINIIDYLRDSGPAELASADALPGILRGAAAAVLMNKHDDFAGLNSKDRVAFVDNVCARQVFDRFKRRMLEKAVSEGPAQTVPMVAPANRTPSDVQKAAPSKPCPVYTTQELLQLETAATGPPAYLTELRYLPELTGASRDVIRQTIRCDIGMKDTQSLVQTPKGPRHASGWATPPLTGSGVGDYMTSGRQRTTDSVSIQTASDQQVRAPAIIVTAPVEIPDPGEKLISFSGEDNGLNASMHNEDGLDHLGKSAGHFTGALSKNKSHLEDLMSMDRIEESEVRGAKDPEVVQTADRFAQMSFDQGRPAWG